MNTEDRRTPGMARVAFDGIVEVGGTLGPSFEASAVDVSEEGMHLRSAYLPELGQQITCRFEAGPNRSVVGSGEVVWSQGADKGGEFGIRFTEMDAECVEALKGVCGVSSGPEPATVPAGGKVRLYIEGLASPMRAKIREAQSGALTVGSDLGFLQVGKRLDLENTQTGDKRPATIDRVDIDVDPSSRVPQLVVTLRYVDGPSVSSGAAARETSQSGGGAHDEETPARMKGAFAEQAARLGPAVDRAMRRMKTTIGLLAKGRPGDDDPMPRRTTAPAPGGGLRADGRRVVRGESAFATDGNAAPGAQVKVSHFGRRRMAIGAAVMATAVLGAFAMKRSHQETAAVVAPPPASGESTPAAAAPPAPEPAAPAPQAPGAVVASPPPTPAPPAQAVANAAAADEKSGASPTGTEDGAKKRPRPQPFANGPVHHGNILRLKMDGPVEAIEGAQEPTGFLVKVPGRRSLEPASPLAARDGRIQTIKVTNGASGAELSVSFKDSVPNYRVSARGDSLVIALAPMGSLQDTTVADSAVGKRTSRGGKAAGHSAHPSTSTASPVGVER